MWRANYTKGLSLDCSRSDCVREDNEHMTVDELHQLAPTSINWIVAKENVEAPVSVQSKTKPQQLTKQDCFIANETGMCPLVLWEENILPLERRKLTCCSKSFTASPDGANKQVSLSAHVNTQEVSPANTSIPASHLRALAPECTFH